MRSTPSLPPMFVGLTTAVSPCFKEGRRALPLSTPLSSEREGLYIATKLRGKEVGGGGGERMREREVKFYILTSCQPYRAAIITS